MHVTSLPGPHGSGDLGPEARRFIDFLSAAGQTWWQMLPVVIPDRLGCPYNTISSRGGSPYLISLQDLAGSGLLAAEEIEPPSDVSDSAVDFATVHAYREGRLRVAYERFVHGAAFRQFCLRQAHWLDDLALFRALKDRAGGQNWTLWDADLRSRKPGALKAAKRELAGELDYHRFVQFIFDRQWRELRRYAHERGVGLIGDLPIFVSHNSADVWANQHLFELDDSGRPMRVSGVPPDTFCTSGQLWGHPQYRWPAHERSGFAWWIDRFGGVLELFDALRIDHFLGFERVWSIPARARSAKPGRWVRSPGAALFRAAREKLGDRPIIAEDLGALTPEAAKLRDDLGFPGMRVLQFGFGNDGGGDPYNRPHSFVRRCVAFTGTHDNPTTGGWYASLDAKAKKTLAEYAGCHVDGRVHEALIRMLMSSVADTAIVPVQDVLGLDDAARMNTPGTKQDNWKWRVGPGVLNEAVAGRLRELVEVYARKR
jgi:4-alpha-glucanotransferase